MVIKATYNRNSEPKENQVLIYNEASQLMEWGPIDKLVNKTEINIIDSADAGQTQFTISSIVDSEERVHVFRNGEEVSFTSSGYTITLDSAADSGDEVRISHVLDSAQHLGIMYWHQNRPSFDSNYDSIRWGTLINLVDSTPTRHQDIPMYDSDTQRMSWGRAPTMVSVIFGEFGDVGGSRTYDSAVAGSYISGTGGSVTGGGLSGQSLSSGVLLGPLDGSSITINAVEGDIVILSRPV